MLNGNCVTPILKYLGQTVSIKVLVIDDDPSLQRLLRARLESHEKVNVEQATGGKDGFRQAVSASPNLIILDWMLPDIQGLDVLKLLKADNKTKDIPVLMLTGKNCIGDIEDAFAMGAEGYLTKPFDLRKLGEKVKGLITGTSH